MRRKLFICLCAFAALAVTSVALAGLPDDFPFDPDDDNGGGKRKSCYANRGAASEMSTVVVCGNPGCFIYSGYNGGGKKGTC